MGGNLTSWSLNALDKSACEPRIAAGGRQGTNEQGNVLREALGIGRVFHGSREHPERHGAIV